MNNLSVSPLPSPVLWSQDSTLTGSSIQSPETKVDQLEREADEQAQHLPEAQRAAYRTMVRREIAHMRTLIAQMRAQGFQENAINGAIGGLTQKFYESKNRFLEGNEQFAINKARVCASNLATANKIRQCTPDFSPIARIPIEDDEDGMTDQTFDYEFKESTALSRSSHESSNSMEISKLEKRKITPARSVQDEDASKTGSRPLDNTHGANVDFSSASSIMTLVQREKAYQNAVTAKITAAAFHAVGYAIKETTAFALGCRSGGEREKNCRIVVGYVKTGAKKVEDGVKYAITAVGLKPAFKRAMSGKALEERLVQIGLPRESSKWYEVSARQFVRDSNTVTANLAFVGAASAVLKIGKSLFSFPRSPFPGETWNKPSKDPTSGKKYKTYTTQGKSGPLFTDRKTYTTEPLRPEYLPRKPLLLELKQKYQLGKQAIKAASAARVTQNTAYASRFDYSADYLLHVNEFINRKEFSGVLKRNLMVVQYHCSSPCHQPRTLKWFMPATQGNKLHTIEEVMNFVSKIKAFGEITQVSVARIPAGEPVKFLHGRAVSKFDSHTNVIRPGSGVQYRFYDFDPKWIVETRALPVTIPKSPIQSHLSRFLKDEGGFIKLPFSGVKEKYPEIQKFLSKVYGSIRSSSKNTPFNNLLDARRGVDLRIFPNTSLEKTLFLQKSHQIEFHPIPNQNNRNLITRISTQKGDFILKKFKDGHDLMGEVMGYDLLQPLNLQNLIIPEVVAIGKEQELFYLLKSYLEGPTIGDLILSTGAESVGTFGRGICLEECLAATKKAGSALGELQRKTSVSAQVLSKEFVDKDCKFWAKLLHDYIEMVNADLKKLGLPQIERSGIDFMVKQRSLMANPPRYSYGFGDIHPGQFVYSKKNGTLGYIDAEYFPSSVGLSKEPLSVGIKDYYLFHSDLEITGILSGLKSYEIKYLQEAFKEGFYSEFPMRRPQPGQEFFELYSAVDTIAALTEDEVVKRFIATKGNAGASFLKQQLQNKVKSINEKIGGPKQKLIANSLTPEHLGLKNLPSESKIGRIGMTHKKMLTIAIEHKDFQNFQPGKFNLFSIIGHIQKLALEEGATSIRVSFPYHEKVLSILEKRYDTTVKTIDLIHEQMPHKIVVKLPVPGNSREAFPMEGKTIRLDKYKQLTPLELDLIPENLRKFEVFSREQDGIYHVKIDHVIPKKGFHVNFLQLKKRISELASENQAHTVRLHFGFDWEPETNQRMHQLLIRMFGEPKMNTATVSFDFKLTTNAYK